MNLWLSCVIVLTAFMSSGSVSSADRLFEEPTFESYDVDPCIRVNGTVNRFKTDIWIASHNYSQCTNNGSMMSKVRSAKGLSLKMNGKEFSATICWTEKNNSTFYQVYLYHACFIVKLIGLFLLSNISCTRFIFIHNYMHSM